MKILFGTMKMHLPGTGTLINLGLHSNLLNLFSHEIPFALVGSCN